MAADPWETLLALGAEVSPDLDAYASGQLSVHQVRCVLCHHAPCDCQRCPVCEMTMQARYGGCPRGCVTFTDLEKGSSSP